MTQGSRQPRPVQLHVVHDLGGGIAKWLGDYCDADTERRNLVLRPLASDAAMARGVALHDGPGEGAPLKSWSFSQPIAAAVATHAQYREALREVIEGWGVQGLVVSSLIGHSLDALDTGLPTLVVCHDYFPWCPAVNLYFGGVCSRCDGARVAACEAGNPEYNPFAGFGAADRVAVRERYVELVRRPSVRVLAPSESVGRNLKALEPRFANLEMQTIPHGYSPPLPRVELGPMPAGDRLRVLVLGQMSRAKGQDLLEAALPRIATFADVFLLGCGEVGEIFKFDSRVHVTKRYEISALPNEVRHVRPHLGLLMSVVAESFSYTLSELSMLGVPCIAPSVGSFPERIRHGQDGFLYSPNVSSLVEALRGADANRAELSRVRGNLASYRHRGTAEMVADYHRAMPLDPPKSAKDAPVAPEEKSAAAEAATVASMWKQVRKLDLELALVNDARQRLEMNRLAEAEARRALEARIQHFARGIAERDGALFGKEMQLQELTKQNRAAAAKLEEIYRSTSWKFSGPVRMVGNVLRWLRGGSAGGQAAKVQQGDWLDYRARLESEVLP